MAAYNTQQKSALGKLLKDRFMEGQAEGYEIVVALIAMVKDGRLKESDIRPLMMEVHSFNSKGVLRSLSLARQLMDEQMINDIINEVNSRR